MACVYSLSRFLSTDEENTSPLSLVVQVSACMFIEQGLAGSQFLSTRISL
jgi:hypothetical protein